MGKTPARSRQRKPGGGVATATIARTRRLRARARRLTLAETRRAPARGASDPSKTRHAPAPRPGAQNPEIPGFGRRTRLRGGARARAGASATRTRASRGERTNGTHHLDEVPCEPRERASQRERGVRRRGKFSTENYFFTPVGRHFLVVHRLARVNGTRPQIFAASSGTSSCAGPTRLSRAHRHARG